MSSKPCKCADGTSFKEECCLVSKILGAPKLKKSSDPIQSKLHKVEQASRKLLQKVIDQSTLKNLSPDMLTKATDEIKKQVNRKMENTMDMVSIVSELFSGGDGDDESKIEQGLIVQPVYISTNKYTGIDQYKLEAIKGTLFGIGIATIFCLIMYCGKQLTIDIAKYIIMEQRKNTPFVYGVFSREIRQYSKKYMWESFSGVGNMNSFSTVVDQFISFIADDLIAKILIIGPILSSIVHMIVRAMKDVLQFIIEVVSISTEIALFDPLFVLLVDTDWIEKHINDLIVAENKDPSIVPKSIGFVTNIGIDKNKDWFEFGPDLEGLLKSQTYSIIHRDYPKNIPLLFVVHENTLKRPVNTQHIYNTFQEIQCQTGNLIFTQIISSARVQGFRHATYGYYSKIPVWSGVNFISTNEPSSSILSFVLPEKTELDKIHNRDSLNHLFSLYTTCLRGHRYYYRNQKCNLPQYKPLTTYDKQYFLSRASKLPFYGDKTSREFNIMTGQMMKFLVKDPLAETAFKLIIKNLIFPTSQPTIWYSVVHDFHNMKDDKTEGLQFSSQPPSKENLAVKWKFAAGLPTIYFPSKVSTDLQLYKEIEQAASCISRYVPLLIIYQDDKIETQFTCNVKSAAFMYMEMTLLS